MTLLAVFLFSPPRTKVHLGLDLQGGVHLVLKVQTDDALRVETETTSDQLREQLVQAKIPVTGIKVTGLTSFAVEGVPQASDQQFRTLVDQQVGTSFERDTLAGTYTFKMRPNIEVNRRSEAVAQAIQTIERRVNELGVSEPVDCAVRIGRRPDHRRAAGSHRRLRARRRSSATRRSSS